MAGGLISKDCVTFNWMVALGGNRTGRNDSDLGQMGVRSKD